MTPRLRYAIGVGALSAFVGCVIAAMLCRTAGKIDVAHVLGLASLPWLALAVWSDRR